MADEAFLAVDLGASSGRVMAGLFDGGRLRLEVVHRFENGPITVRGTKHWDLLAQWQAVLAGLRKARQQTGATIRSVGVDTWGVDFGLLGRGDVLLGNPVHYRDHRTDGLMQAAFDIVPREEIFAATGLQFMQFNTLYQLLAMRLQESPLLEVAERLLLIPDLFHWMLSGEKSNERTNASTTQFYDPQRGTWAKGLLARLSLPTQIVDTLIEPGTRLGPILPEVEQETGLRGLSVVVPATHDTASAVAAVPARGDDWCFVSSGTWSLMGVETPAPVVTDLCRELNFTNEAGVRGTTRLLKNIAGLWLVQESRRAMQRAGREYSWEQLAQLAAQAPPRVSLVDPDHADFLAPDDMPRAIAEYCRRTGQPVPETDGHVVRVALESIALKHRYVLECLELLIGRRLNTIHIVGGGTQNVPLCQATADACGRPVVAGPVEATATGNLLLQAIAAGSVASLDEGRALVGRSFELATYEPRDSARWDEAYRRFLEVVALTAPLTRKS